MNQELMDMANKTLELMPPDNHYRELYWSSTDEELEAFSALVAAAEREACAKVCEVIQAQWLEVPSPKRSGYVLAEAIRARGETE